MSNRRLLITAGPTHEPIDDVRYLANRSSGRMGIALAGAARDAGWAVTLLLGPVSASPPQGCRVQRFETSNDLETCLVSAFPDCEVLIMAAAVADYRPSRRSTGKLPRSGERMILELEPVPDLVAACARSKRSGQVLIGFSLESPEVLAVRARQKLAAKGLDAVVANPLETMGSAVITPVLILRDGTEFRPPTGVMAKEAFARWLMERIQTNVWRDEKRGGTS